MGQPKLSVLVITYNQAEYLAQTLESILSQEHGYEYEIVVGDDCSSDGTRDVLLRYADEHPGIVKPLLNGKNKGIIGNYFNVARECLGEYVMECAGDDYWLPGKVAAQIGFMEKRPEIGMCYSKARMELVGREGGRVRAWGGPATSFEELISRNRVPAMTVCFRRELLLRYIEEIRPEDRGWMMEDYPCWLWFALKAGIAFDPRVMAAYRVFDESAGHSGDYEKVRKALDSDYAVKSFFLEYSGLTTLAGSVKDSANRQYAYNALVKGRYREAREFFAAMTEHSPKDRIGMAIAGSRILGRVYSTFRRHG